MRILVLGVTGMFGGTAFRLLSRQAEVFGTARDAACRRWFPDIAAERILTGVEACDTEGLREVLARVQPDVVINAIGVIPQGGVDLDPLAAIRINAELPHRLATLCAEAGARLIHISSDSVFSGRTGGYCEDDRPDAEDLYALTKRLGEVDQPHVLTLRTSIIGPELATRRGLFGWFLSQHRGVRGYAGAVFSGVTSPELTRAIADHILPRPELRGIYHLASTPISKYDLLQLIRAEYRLSVAIERVDRPIVDRSLNGQRFRAATGYVAPAWPEMIRRMHALDQPAARRAG